MTKEIIIDNVNVAECQFITKAKEAGDQYCTLYEYNYCLGKSCYYKQLKRLEVENAMLKRHKRELGNVAQQFVKDIEKYKETLEKIKNLVSGYRSCYAEPILEIIEGAEDE